MEQKLIFGEMFKEYCSKGQQSDEFYKSMMTQVDVVLNNACYASDGTAFLNESHTARMIRHFKEEEVNSAYRALTQFYKNAIAASNIVDLTINPIKLDEGSVTQTLCGVLSEIAKECAENRQIEKYLVRANYDEELAEKLMQGKPMYPRHF